MSLGSVKYILRTDRLKKRGGELSKTQIVHTQQVASNCPKPMHSAPSSMSALQRYRPYGQGSRLAVGDQQKTFIPCRGMTAFPGRGHKLFFRRGSRAYKGCSPLTFMAARRRFWHLASVNLPSALCAHQVCVFPWKRRVAPFLCSSPSRVRRSPPRR